MYAGVPVSSPVRVRRSSPSTLLSPKSTIFTPAGAGELDARIDQYALGVVLHQALAGRLPFVLSKHPGALMFDVVMGKGEPLAVAAPDVPEAVRAVVARAMAPKRDDRYEDVLALARAFAEAA